MVLGVACNLNFPVFKGKIPRALDVLGKFVFFPKIIHKRTAECSSSLPLVGGAGYAREQGAAELPWEQSRGLLWGYPGPRESSSSSAPRWGQGRPDTKLSTAGALPDRRGSPRI